MTGKITSKKGETLAELLASVLVISLGLTMFATALMSSKRMLELGQAKMEAYYTGRNALEAERDTDQISGSLTVEGEDGSGMDLGAPAGGTRSGSYAVKVYRGNSGSMEIFRYKK